MSLTSLRESCSRKFRRNSKGDHKKMFEDIPKRTKCFEEFAVPDVLNCEFFKTLHCTSKAIIEQKTPAKIVKKFYLKFMEELLVSFTAVTDGNYLTDLQDFFFSRKSSRTFASVCFVCKVLRQLRVIPDAFMTL